MTLFDIVLAILMLASHVAIVGAAWLCRKRSKAFLFLGALLIGWQWVHLAGQGVLASVVELPPMSEHLSFFPFSPLIVDAGGPGWRSVPNSTVRSFNLGLDLLRCALYAAVFALIARSLGKNRACDSPS